MLAFVEYIALLQLDYAAGRPTDLPSSALDVTIAGAALLELALQNRIDADLDRFFLADPTPTGDAVLDDALQMLERAGADFSARTAIECTVDHAGDYRRMALEQLLAKDIVARQGDGRYSIANDRELGELKERLRQELLSDEIPDPINIMLICLVEAAGLLGLVLNTDEAQRARGRIDQISRLDLIGHAVAWAVADMRFIVRH